MLVSLPWTGDLLICSLPRPVTEENFSKEFKFGNFSSQIAHPYIKMS